MKKKTIQDLFPGIMVLDSEPVVVQNPFSGESIKLQPEEVAVYDYLKGCELMGDHKSLADTVNRARHYGAVARDALGIFPDSTVKAALLDIIDFSIERAY